MGLIERQQHMDYWNVSRGALRKTTTEDDPLAVKRTYTNKEGVEKTIYEQVKAGVSGYIDGVKINDGQFGKQLVIYIKDVDEFGLQMPWDSSEASSFCEKLRSVDISKEVEILPYDFVPKGRKKAVRGVTVMQEGKKLSSYFVELDADGRFVGYKHGFPSADGDTEAYDSEDWKILFAQQRKFLRTEVVEKFPFLEVSDDVNDADEQIENNNEKSDLPF